MSVRLEFISFIVRRDKIDQKYPGGWDQCLKVHKNFIGGRVWYDNYLLRNGAMDSEDIKYLLEYWVSLGFEGIVTKNGQENWGDDLCVVDALGGPTLPCDWIENIKEDNVVYLKGTEPGSIIGREEMNNI